MRVPSYRVSTDDNGWVKTISMREGMPESGEPSDAKPCPFELGRIIFHHPPALMRALHHRDGVFSTPRTDRQAWRLMRSLRLTGADAYGHVTLTRSLRSLLPDVDPSVVLPEIVPMTPESPIRATFDDVPGLELRPMTHTDIDTITPLAVDSGLYPDICPTDPPCCDPPTDHAWCQVAQRLDNVGVWQTALVFEDRPLQFELVSFDGGVPLINMTVHATRERPHWFWREAQKPVWQALRASGYMLARSATRKDREDWIQQLKDNYQAVELGENDNTKTLEFSITANIFQGWPQRKTLPSWQYTSGNVLVRELTAADLASVATWLNTRWGANPRKVLAIRMLREWFFLDRATLIGIFQDSVLQDIRVIRYRRDTTCGIAALSPLLNDTVHPTMLLALRQWIQNSGYTRATMFIPESMITNSRVAARLQASGSAEIARHPQFRIPMVEYEVTV